MIIQSFLPDRRHGGFTLIELLIVIAIILILIAIALPNFLEAQMRARVTKAKGEMRSLHLAMDSYFLDWKIYPAEHERDEGGKNNRRQRGLEWLTSPISYIKHLPEDPFAAFGEDSKVTTYVTYETGGLERGGSDLSLCPWCMVTWMMFSNGPDYQQGINAADATFGNDVRNYAPTNGTKSRGSIYRWGGDPWWIGINVGNAVNPTTIKPVSLVGLRVDGQTYIHRLPPF